MPAWERAGRVKGAERRSEPLTRPSAPAKSIAGATAGSAPNEPLHQSSYVRDVQKFAGPHHVHRLVLLAIEVSGCRVHGHDEFRVCGKRAFEKTVVGFVPDNTELGQRIAHREALDDFSDEFRVVAEDVRVLFEDGRTDPRLDQTGVRELVDECRCVAVSRNVATFRMQVSRTTRKVRPGATQRPCASLRFDKGNRFGLGHRLPPVLAVRSRQRRGQLEPDNLATNDGRRVHDISVCGGSY